jgi:probable rRNA maturation factor
MITIQLDENVTFDDTDLNENTIIDTAQAVMQHEQVDLSASLSIVLSDDAHLQDLNLQFMGIAAPTDVLSFPAGEVDPDSGTLYLGDVIVSVERASAQASAQGHSMEAEILLLIVHGMLHLLGHDHAEPAEKQRMWAAQAAILEVLAVQTGIQPALPPE